jgi:hypothetical protein
MPVEIKELVIRAVVDSAGGHASRDRAAPPGDASAHAGIEPEEREAIVAAAVKEVLRILRASRER